MAKISEYEDIMDSRDVIERLEELENDGANERRTEHPDLIPSDEDRETLEELDKLRALAAEAEGSPDWVHGEALIRDSYFQEYAQDLAEDCGLIQEGAQWPNNCIDWEQATRDLKMDYMSVDYGETEYWIRA